MGRKTIQMTARYAYLAHGYLRNAAEIQEHRKPTDEEMFAARGGHFRRS